MTAGALRRVRSAALHLVRTEARLIGLRGTDRLLRLLYHPDHRDDDYEVCVGRYRQFLIHIDTRSFLEWYLFAYGHYERAAVDLLCGLTPPGGVVFDVGANIGVFTLPFAHAVGSSGRVYAFEPHPRVCERLVQNASVNNLRNLTICSFALSNKSGVVTLHGFTTADQGTSSIVAAPATGAPSFSCVVETLDGFVRSRGISRIDVIKVDAEGADLLVLQGAKETLRKYRPCVYVEVSPKHMAQIPASPVDLWQILHGAGYVVYHHVRGRGSSAGLTPIDCSKLGTFTEAQTWLAVHTESIERIDGSIQPPN